MKRVLCKNVLYKDVLYKNILRQGALIMFSLLTSVGYAAQTPMKSALDPRVSTIAYSKDNVVKVQGTTFVATQLRFAEDEVVRNIQSGDAAAWTTKIDENLPNRIFIKPESYDSHTNMTVITNKRTYYFELNVNKQGESAATPSYAINFIYPEAEKEKQLQAVLKKEKAKKAKLSIFRRPADYEWDYSFYGDTPLVPLHVFDDGEFTYFQLRQQQQLPAVFMVDNAEGKESLVNVRREGEYLIAEGIAPQFTLRSGDAMVASIFNNKLVHKLAGSKPASVRRQHG